MQAIAFSRLELILLVLLVLVGMGAWDAAEYTADAFWRGKAPVEEAFDHQVLAPQAEMAAMREDLARTTEEALRQQVVIDQLITECHRMEAAYPQLASVSSALSGTLVVPVDVVASYLEVLVEAEREREAIDSLGDQLAMSAEAVARTTASLETEHPQRADIVFTEARLTAARAELGVMQQELAERRLRTEVLSATHEAILELYPQLGENASLTEGSAAGVPAEVLQGHRDNLLEMMATRRLIIALEGDLGVCASTIADLSLVLAEGKEEGRRDRVAAEAESILAQAEFDALQLALGQRQQSLAEHTAAVAALGDTYPGLETLTAAISATAGVPSVVLLAYLDTHGQLLHARFQHERLVVAQDQQLARIVERSPELSKARMEAARGFSEAQNLFNLGKCWATLGLSIVYGGVLLGAAWGGLSLLCRHAGLKETIDLAMVMYGVGVGLSLLFAYQAFDTIGVATVSVVILLVVILKIARHREAEQSESEEVGR